MSTTPLTIGDGSGWHFVNGAWTDGDGGALTVPPDLLNAEMAPLQGAHFAFDRTRAYQDCRISFDFLLRGHSDAGIILRARDESHFYLVHFPNCGQASRAQHFWVALSKMDDAGYLTLIKLEMVPRVPSTNGIPLHCEITLQGDRFTVPSGTTAASRRATAPTAAPAPPARTCSGRRSSPTCASRGRPPRRAGGPVSSIPPTGGTRCRPDPGTGNSRST